MLTPPENLVFLPCLIELLHFGIIKFIHSFHYILKINLVVGYGLEFRIDLLPFLSGQFICGNKHCDEKDDLASYEASVLVTSLISLAFYGNGKFFVGL